MNVNIKANELYNAILQSNEYKTLVSAKENINKNKEFKAKIKELKERQKELQLAMFQNKADKNKIDNLNKAYNDAIKIAEVKNYLDTEKIFSDFVVKILKDISDRIENSLK